MDQKKISSEELELKYVDQGIEGLDAWVRKGQSAWVRLDFIFEYYLFGNVNLSKRYKGLLSDNNKARQYHELFYAKVFKETSNGESFDFQSYLDWQRNNPSNVNEALQLLQSA